MDSRRLATGTLLKNRYRVARLVAGGGMAWVYEVEETRADGTRVSWALKELRSDSHTEATLSEARHLFEQEAQILVRLSHPNLPKVAAFFEQDARSYLVMEFIHGTSLARRLEEANAPLLEQQVLDWAIQICDVLGYLHRRPKPIIFRDLKPSNVMVTPGDVVKLIDFGIARTHKAGQERDTISMGSENYAAPEQWGKTQTDARADIYGLGATMYHLLTNVPPIPAFVPAPRVPAQHYNPSLSDRTQGVIDRAMSANRNDRYQTAADMREALLQCLSPRARARAEARSRQRSLAASSSALSTPPAPPAAMARPQPVAVQTKLSPTTPRRLATEPQRVRWCATCGAENRSGARFCKNCGADLGAARYAVLKIIEPSPAHWEYPLRKRLTLVGRRGGTLPVDLDVGYYDPEGYVSRNHARFTRFEQRYHVIDLDSSNGTRVNGERLVPHQARALRPGDRVRMGQITFVFLLC